MSIAERLLYSGAMSGWMIETTPLNARASPHDSRKCDCGMCHWQRNEVSS
jgi:hypothetical protein